MKKYLLTALSIFSISYSDPLMILPDTRANGMAGAFTAIANNPSSIYYNPAGLTSSMNQNFFVGTLEGGESIKNNNGDLKKSGRFFLGISGIKGDGGLAFAIFSERSATLPTTIKTDQGEYTDTVEQDLYSLALAGSWQIIRSNSNKFLLSLGFSGGVVTTGTLNTSTESYDGGFVGWWFGAGIKSKLYENENFGIFAGAAGRKFSNLEYKDNTTGDKIDLEDLPDEYSAGIALSFYTTKGTLTVSLDHRKRIYNTGEYNEFSYNINSIGMEFALPKIQIRGGIYKSTPKDVYIGTLYDTTVKGTTAGIGFKLGKSFIFNISYEKRKFEGNSTKSFNLISASLNITESFSKNSKSSKGKK